MAVARHCPKRQTPKRHRQALEDLIGTKSNFWPKSITLVDNNQILSRSSFARGVRLTRYAMFGPLLSEYLLSGSTLTAFGLLQPLPHRRLDLGELRIVPM